MKTRIGIVTYARNEQDYLPKTLSAIGSQTLKPSAVVLVDDGSSDRTAEIATRYGWDVVSRSDRGYSAITTSALAEVVNAGLERLESARLDYIQIIGADDVLPDCYLQVVAERMEADPDLAIAGGRSCFDRRGSPYPRGLRMVRRRCWNPPRYPVIPGWETYIIYKVLKEGHKVTKYDDIVYYPQRRPGQNWNWEGLGRTMRSLGYHPLVLAGRLIKVGLRSPLNAGKTLRGYLAETSICDIADWIRTYQRERILASISFLSPMF